MRRPLLLLLCLLALTARPRWLAAQSLLPLLDEYQVRLFEADEGLPVRWVRVFAQTSDGLLYVPTEQGLVRFDGQRFEPGGFDGQYVLADVFMDHGDRLWVGSREGDIGFVLDRQVHVLTSRLPHPEAAISVSGTADGAAWIGGVSGLTRIGPGAEPEIGHFTREHGLPNDSTVGVFSLPNGEDVAVTQTGLARVRHDESRPGGARFEPFGPTFVLPTIRRAVVLVDGAGLWLSFGDRVLVYRDGRVQSRLSTPSDPSLDLSAFQWHDDESYLLPRAFARHLKIPPVPLATGDHADRVSMALRSRGGTVWLVVTSPADGRERDHLVRFRDGRFDAIALQSRLTVDRINHLLEDDEGSIWIATDQGVLQLVPRRVRALTERQGLSHGFTTAVLQTRDGALWVGTWGGGLQRFFGGRIESVTRESGLPSNRIRALYEARDGTLWIGTEAGFAAVRDGRVVSREEDPSAPSIFGGSIDEVRAFAEMSDGRLWMAGADGLRVRSSSGWAEYRPEIFGRADVWTLHATQDGALWVGGERGLFRLRADEVQSFGEVDGLKSPFVVSIHEEADGTMWVGTYGDGLHRWRDGRFAAVTTAEGLQADGVWRVLEDDAEGLWMSSDLGVFRVDRERLHAAADAVSGGDPPANLLRPMVLQEAEGMPSRESNRASPGGWRLSDGRLVFNSQEGLAVITPREAMAQIAPPGVVVDRVLADGADVPAFPGPPRTMPLGSRHLAFEFFALSYRAPNQTRYRYRMDGYDVDWNYAGTGRRASYTNLPPGGYTFRVQATNGDAPWSGEEARYALVLPPFLWQQLPVQVAASLALLALIGLGYRYHIGRLLQMERLRLRIAADLHDDVGSSLSSIALLSEMLKGRAPLKGLELKQLERIHDAAADTIVSLREVIWLVDPKHGNLVELVNKFRGTAANLLNGISHSFDATELRPRPVSMSFMRQVLLVYKEALHNVVTHARAEHVTIRVAETRGSLMLIIEDDGIGFVEDSSARGRGLQNMRSRAKEAGGELSITSDSGGTRVVFVAKIA